MSYVRELYITITDDGEGGFKVVYQGDPIIFGTGCHVGPQDKLVLTLTGALHRDTMLGMGKADLLVRE